MIDRISRFWSGVLRMVGLRAPRGHMEMLRDTVGRREDERMARDTGNGQQQVSSVTTAAPAPDVHDRID
jgi:hypothetical protein